MAAKMMRIEDSSATELVEERMVYEQLLPLDGARIVELGCGAAGYTRAITQTGRPESIVACEVDDRQHEKNLSITDLPGVKFVRAGAEAIPAEDSSVDIVLMFKSLHHVPVDAMGTALREIARVLRPGGLAYISEPVYAGEFNEVLRLFHDEKGVRLAAFSAMKEAVREGVLELVEERFFRIRNEFQDFADFEQRIIRATHTKHALSPELYETVRQVFERHVGPEGACFAMPMRVDLLRRPDASG